MSAEIHMDFNGSTDSYISIMAEILLFENWNDSAITIIEQIYLNL